MTTRDGTPSRKLAGVPLAVRRLWSLLYRAERRHAVALDELRGRVDELERWIDETRRVRVEHVRRTVALEDRVLRVEEVLTVTGRDDGPP